MLTLLEEKYKLVCGKTELNINEIEKLHSFSALYAENLRNCVLIMANKAQQVRFS